jgi:Svf1-like N-terminal lipocalin domain
VSDPLTNYRFDDDKYCFYADDCSIELNEDGTEYKVKSSTNPKAVVDLTFTRITPAFQVGKDGTSYFGEDPEYPWGSMRHSFWPRCKLEGSIMTPTGPVDFKGRGFYVYALQGMKPHHLGRPNLFSLDSSLTCLQLPAGTSPTSSPRLTAR